jgi:hypothetical protein
LVPSFWGELALIGSLPEPFPYACRRTSAARFRRASA